MDFLDYAQLTTGQKIAYKVKSFFTGIPGAIAGVVKAIVKKTKHKEAFVKKSYYSQFFKQYESPFTV